MKASILSQKRKEDYLSNRLSPPPQIDMPGTGFYLKQNKHRLVIIGGMPGTGKTAYTVQSALSLAEQGYAVLICTYEMHTDAIIDRMWSNAQNILCDDLDNYAATEESISKAASDKRLERIFISSPRSVNELHKYIQGNIYNDPDLSDTKKPEIIVIWDYLQRIPFHTDLSTPKDRVSATLQDILTINTVLDVHSIVLASLNREGYHLTSMEAFKEAGDIESDTDMAIIMRLGVNKNGNWMPVRKEELNEERKNKQVNIIFSMVKNRHGAEIEFVMGFDKPYQQFNNEIYNNEDIKVEVPKTTTKLKVVKGGSDNDLQDY